MGNACSRVRAPMPTTFPKPARPAEEVEAEERIASIRQRAVDAAAAAERASSAQRRLQRRAESAKKRAALMATEAERAKRAAARLEDPAYVPASDDEDDDYYDDDELFSHERHREASSPPRTPPVKEKPACESIPSKAVAPFPSVRDAAKLFETLAQPPEPPPAAPPPPPAARVCFAALPGSTMPPSPPQLPSLPPAARGIMLAPPLQRKPGSLVLPSLLQPPSLPPAARGIMLTPPLQRNQTRSANVARENGAHSPLAPGELPPSSPLSPPSGAVTARLKAFEALAAEPPPPPPPVPTRLPLGFDAAFTCTAIDPCLPPDPRSAVGLALQRGGLGAPGVADRLRALERGPAPASAARTAIEVYTPPPRAAGGGSLLSMLQAFEAKDRVAAQEMEVQSFEQRYRVSQLTRERLDE